MDCSKCAQLIELYVAGSLDEKTAETVENHLRNCDVCKKEYEDVKWLSDGLNAVGEVVRSGHMSSRLLYEYSESSVTLERETISRIEAHLSTCANCRDDLSSIRDLQTKEIRAGDTGKTGNLQTLRNLWWKKPLIPVFAAAVVLILVTYVAYLKFIQTETYGFRAELVAESALRPSDSMAHELTFGYVTRGGLDAGQLPVMEIGRSFPDVVVLGLDLSVVDEDDTPTHLAINDGDGEKVWGARIYVPETSRMFLSIERKTFKPGTYTITIFDQIDSPLAKSRLVFHDSR